VTDTAAMIEAAEEKVTGTPGDMYLTSTDLELMHDGTDEQVVAMRFGPVNIPAGAKLLSASISFVIDEVPAGADQPITIAIYAEATDSSSPFSDSDYDLSSRPATQTSRVWMPPRSTDPAGSEWSVCWDVNRCAATEWSEVGAAVRSPNIAHILQEVLDRPGWRAGNAITVVFAQVSGTGTRTVESGQQYVRLEYEYDVTPRPVPSADAVCGGSVAGTLHGPPSCERAYEGSGCGACPFGSEGDPDLMPSGWTAGAAQRCIVPEGSTFVGGTRLCYCHGNVAAGAGERQSCEVFGTEWFRNHQSGHYADVDFEFLVRPADCNPTEASSSGYVCSHNKHNTILLAGTEDSAEQDAFEGSMYLTSTDLELMHDETTAEACPSCPGGGSAAGSEQVVALRFNNVQIPRGAGLSEAHIGFEIDEVNEPQSSLPVVIAIYGEYSGNAAEISGRQFDLSSRPPTDMAVTWSPAGSSEEPETWGTVGGVVSTPSLVNVIEEITSHPAWRPGNSLMILFGHVSGAGVRWMVSHEDNENLHGGPFLSYSFQESTGYAAVVGLGGPGYGVGSCNGNQMRQTDSGEACLFPFE
jgi:hypothetical protein